MNRLNLAKKPAKEPDGTTNEPDESTIEPGISTIEPDILQTNPTAQLVAGNLENRSEAMS